MKYVEFEMITLLKYINKAKEGKARGLIEIKQEHKVLV